MKIIQTFNDIKRLKVENAVPKELMKEIEQDFLTLYESSGIDDDLVNFCLPYYEAIILLEIGDNVLVLLDNPMVLEYVEKHKQGQIEFYRIAKRIGHEFQLIYTLVGIYDEKIEQILDEHAEWNEGSGDF